MLAANFTLSAEEDKDISMTLERKLQSNNLKVAGPVSSSRMRINMT